MIKKKKNRDMKYAFLVINKMLINLAYIVYMYKQCECVCVCVYVYIYIYIYMCVCVCVCIYMYKQCEYIYLYLYGIYSSIHVCNIDREIREYCWEEMIVNYIEI